VALVLVVHGIGESLWSDKGRGLPISSIAESCADMRRLGARRSIASHRIASHRIASHGMASWHGMA
jgi:hypothetical protein